MSTKDNLDKKKLYEALLSLEDVKEMERFITDLCTPAEIKACAERWEIARMLHETDMGYREISTKTGASTTTVGRVARFLNQESYQGYRLVLDRLKSKK